MFGTIGLAVLRPHFRPRRPPRPAKLTSTAGFINILQPALCRDCKLRKTLRQSHCGPDFFGTVLQGLGLGQLAHCIGCTIEDDNIFGRVGQNEALPLLSAAGAHSVGAVGSEAVVRLVSQRLI
jgi:hypothetical protein